MASSDRSETNRTGSHTHIHTHTHKHTNTHLHKTFATTTFSTYVVYFKTPTMSTTVKTTSEMDHVMFTYYGQRLFYNMTQQNIFQSLKTNNIFKCTG